MGDKLSEKDQEKVYDAMLLMFDLHLGQRDRAGGEPYVTHPISVASKVLQMKADKDLVISALLHDSIEDQGEKITLSDIEEKYRKKVRNVVSSLCEPDFEKILGEKGLSSEEFRKEKYKVYAEHVAKTIEDFDCLVVKLADFTDNTLGLSDLPEDKESQVNRKRNLTNKYLPVMDIFLKRLGRDNLFPDYQEKIRQEQERLKEKTASE